jgi:hypothetical protein
VRRRIGIDVGGTNTDAVLIEEGKVAGADPAPIPLAFIGVRACELTALQIQDHVFLDGPAIDPDYRARRASAFVVAVECATPTSTCFCTSMGTGPEVTSAFDVSLTELDDGYVFRVGSAAGARLIDALDLPPATKPAIAAAAGVVTGARAAMGTPIDMSGVHHGLQAAPDHPGWAAVAERCLAMNCEVVPFDRGNPASVHRLNMVGQHVKIPVGVRGHLQHSAVVQSQLHRICPWKNDDLIESVPKLTSLARSITPRRGGRPRSRWSCSSAISRSTNWQRAASV